MTKTLNKTYIGDSVYAEVDEFANLILTTQNDDSGPRNTIHIERGMLAKISEYYQSIVSPDQPPIKGLEAIEETIKNAKRQKLVALQFVGLLSGFEGRKEFSICNNSFDFDNYTHDEVIALMRHLGGGKWEKSVNCSGTTIDYCNSTLISGFCVRFWSGEPPPSCRIEMVEEVVPEHIEKRAKLVCAELKPTDEVNL